LKESEEYPSEVYHFTTPSAILKIFKDNELKVGYEGDISFTSDPELWIFRGPHDHESDEIGVKIAFKTKNLPKLIKYDDSSHDLDLSYEEEYVYNHNINNILSKIDYIEVDGSVLPETKNWPIQLKNKLK